MRSDRLGFRLSQPLRVEGGGLSLLLPTAYDYATARAMMNRAELSFVPSGRELDAELAYSRPVLGGWFDANLFARRQPGHIATSNLDVGGAIRFKLDL